MSDVSSIRLIVSASERWQMDIPEGDHRTWNIDQWVMAFFPLTDMVFPGDEAAYIAKHSVETSRSTN
jgi:hypothetical protein